MEVVGGRRRYWFQNCSVEHGGKEEGTEEDSEEGEEDEAEEGVDDPLETEEARDLNEKFDNRVFSLPARYAGPTARLPGEKEEVLAANGFV